VITVNTSSVDETRKLGAALAEVARPGDVILLSGDLGAGKTALTQGLGLGLGVEAPITSPTFVLARHYKGRLVLHHLDVYRLEQMDEVFDVGIPEMLDDHAVLVVEWGDAISPALPADFLEVKLTFGATDDDRAITFRPVGPRWTGRLRSLEQTLGPFMSEREG
jgi:tRNA threonylcarbamoyladenosine biosynthesis protein TsaE